MILGTVMFIFFTGILWTENYISILFLMSLIQNLICNYYQLWLYGRKDIRYFPCCLKTYNSYAKVDGLSCYNHVKYINTHVISYVSILIQGRQLIF